MKGPGGKGQGKPGRGKGKGKGKGKDKTKGKVSVAGVGSTYANPGRPKSFQPTQQDRQRTGDIAEYFRRTQNTPRPEARVCVYLQHVDGHVITCQPKAWMDTGGFAMYIQTVLAPWWQKQQTSWTGPDEFPAKRLLLVCDNASVHKADELKKLMEQYCFILMFLPPNMTQWLQPLDRVVCGLIKIVRAPRAALGSAFETIEAGARTYCRGSIA